MLSDQGKYLPRCRRRVFKISNNCPVISDATVTQQWCNSNTVLAKSVLIMPTFINICSYYIFHQRVSNFVSLANDPDKIVEDVTSELPMTCASYCENVSENASSGVSSFQLFPFTLLGHLLKSKLGALPSGNSNEIFCPT